MSQRTTRSRAAQATHISLEDITTPKEKSRRLEQKDINSLQKYLKAYIIHRKRNQSPTKHADDPTQMINNLRKIYTQLLKKPKGDTPEIATRPVYEQKWIELATHLIQSGVTSWRVLDHGLKKAYSSIQFQISNPVEDLLQEGHIRERVFTKIDTSDIQKYYDKDRVGNFTKEQMLDYILQANNPSSKIHLDIVKWIQKGEWSYMKWFFKTVQTEVDGVKVTIDINAHNAGSYLLDLLVAIPILHKNLEHNRFLEVTDFVKFLVEDMKINVFVKHSHAGAYFNAMTLALYMCVQRLWAGVAWDIVKILLKSYKLTDFYYDGIPEKLTPHGGKHYGVVVIPQKEYVINNMWICDQLRIEQFVWLLEHGGMDPRETGGLYPDIQDYMNKTYKKVKDDFETIEKSYNVTTNALADIENRLRSLQDEQTTLTELARTQQTELSTKQTLFRSLGDKKQGIDTTLDKMNVYLGGGKKIKTNKASNKIQRKQ
jgi:hypothetical protein